MLTNHNYIVDKEHKFGLVHFDYIDDNRIVDYQRTAFVAFSIEIWFDKNEYSFRRGFMIPENSKYAMEHCETLLTDDITLSFNEALFLLLGLDVLTLALPQFSNMDLINYKKSLDSSNMIEDIFINTSEFNELIRSNLTNNRIKSKELVSLGENYGFFKKYTNFLEKRTANNKIMKELHELLLDFDYITGEFNDLWRWINKRNQLSYLAKQLKHMRVFNDNCHQQIQHYIKDPSKAKRPLKNIKDPVNTKTIDNIIAKLKP